MKMSPAFQKCSSTSAPRFSNPDGMTYAAAITALSKGTRDALTPFYEGSRNTAALQIPLVRVRWLMGPCDPVAAGGSKTATCLSGLSLCFMHCVSFGPHLNFAVG